MVIKVKKLKKLKHKYLDLISYVKKRTNILYFATNRNTRKKMQMQQYPSRNDDSTSRNR